MRTPRPHQQVLLRPASIVPPVLSLDEAAALIDACDSISTPDRSIRAIVATMLLTGARVSESLALSVADVDFERKLVVLKVTKNRGRRTVPLFPQLQSELRAHLAIRGTAPGPLFPTLAGRGGSARAILQRCLAVAARAAGITREVRLSTLRWTYAAARVQTTQGGAAVSPLVVLRELGIRSGSIPLGHVLRNMNALRSRSRLNEGVEYRRS